MLTLGDQFDFFRDRRITLGLRRHFRCAGERSLDAVSSLGIGGRFQDRLVDPHLNVVDRLVGHRIDDLSEGGRVAPQQHGQRLRVLRDGRFATSRFEIGRGDFEND